jgi:hypothetical protein
VRYKVCGWGCTRDEHLSRSGALVVQLLSNLFKRPIPVWSRPYQLFVLLKLSQPLASLIEIGRPLPKAEPEQVVSKPRTKEGRTRDGRHSRRS